jgi:SAM-dependent methyltransferase
MTDLFDADAMYDEDYLHFFAGPAGPKLRAPGISAGSDSATTDLIWQLLDLRPGLRVLDLACGHGNLANSLAARGCLVTGLDFSSVFLDRARADAAALGVEVEYVHGDMRNLPWHDQFDRVVNWSTAFGYFDDDANRGVLAQIVAALKPGGKLAMDLNNLVARLSSFQPSRVLAIEGEDRLADRYRLDPLTARLWVERTVIREGRARQVTFVVRLFAYPEIRDWLLQAGFAGITGHGEDGRPLAAEHDRMIVVADLPA